MGHLCGNQFALAYLKGCASRDWSHLGDCPDRLRSGGPHAWAGLFFSPTLTPPASNPRATITLTADRGNVQRSRSSSCIASRLPAAVYTWRPSTWMLVFRSEGESDELYPNPRTLSSHRSISTVCWSSACLIPPLPFLHAWSHRWVCPAFRELSSSHSG